MALWTSQREDHASDWLRTVPISGLGQTMNDKTYRCVLCYRLDHAVSCAGIVGFKHRRNVVSDTLVDICYRSGISADLTGSSPLTQTGMTDFVPGCAVIDVAHRKHEADAVSLLKRIQKFSMTQDIGARAVVYIFNTIGFSIAKGVRAQIVSQFPFNLL
ncbi:hypothetical protein Tco_0257434 [Tanacetum coccineum]